MASIRIPTPLRSYTKGADEVVVAGSTVREALANLSGAHPGIGPRILEEGGAVRRFVNLYVNQKDVRTLGGLDAAVKDGDVLSIVPAIAGGAD